MNVKLNSFKNYKLKLKIGFLQQKTDINLKKNYHKRTISNPNFIFNYKNNVEIKKRDIKKDLNEIFKIKSNSISKNNSRINSNKVLNFKKFNLYSNIKIKNKINDNIKIKNKHVSYNYSIKQILNKFTIYFKKNLGKNIKDSKNNLNYSYDNNINNIYENLNLELLINLKLIINYKNKDLYVVTSIKNKNLILGIIRYIKNQEFVNFNKIIKNTYEYYISFLNQINCTLKIISDNSISFYENFIKIFIKKKIISHTIKKELNLNFEENIVILDEIRKNILLSLIFKFVQNGKSSLLYLNCQHTLNFNFIKKVSTKKKKEIISIKPFRNSITFRPSILKKKVNKNFVLNNENLNKFQTKNIYKNFDFIKKSIDKKKSIFDINKKDLNFKIHSFKNLNKNFNEEEIPNEIDPEINFLFPGQSQSIYKKLNDIKSNLKKLNL